MIKEFIKQAVPAPFLPFAKKIYRFFKYDIYSYIKYSGVYKKRIGRKNIYLIGTPEHNNLGDHAIAMAATRFLEHNANDYNIHEISLNAYMEQLACLHKYIQKEDIILINGGGSMGIEWFFYEELIRTYIEKFPHNKIIIMPQTIYYGPSEYGKQEFENSERIYAAHLDLHIIAREKYSYEIMKSAYPKNDVLLIPDMVLYLNYSHPHFERNGVLLCLRKDVEKKLTPSQTEEIYNWCRLYTDLICYTDTVVGVEVKCAMREQELNQKFNEFKHAQLVITDRLHGMVFCAITGTPCIALSNYNHKIKGVYEWIKDLDYIRYLDDYREIPKHIPELMNLENCQYDNRIFASYFEKIAKLIINWTCCFSIFCL